MKPVSGREMVKILRGRGWWLDRIEGSHHVMKHADFPRSIAVPVHGNQDLKTGLQRAIMRQAGLTHTDL